MNADNLPYCVRKLTRLRDEIDDKEADLEEIFQSIGKNEERLSYLLDLQVKANQARIESRYIRGSIDYIEAKLQIYSENERTLKDTINDLGEKFDKAKKEVEGIGWHNSLFHGWIMTEVKEAEQTDREEELQKIFEGEDGQ